MLKKLGKPEASVSTQVVTWFLQKRLSQCHRTLGSESQTFCANHSENAYNESVKRYSKHHFKISKGILSKTPLVVLSEILPAIFTFKTLSVFFFIRLKFSRLGFPETLWDIFQAFLQNFLWPVISLKFQIKTCQDLS